MATKQNRSVWTECHRWGLALAVLVAAASGCDINSSVAGDEDSDGGGDFFITPKSVSLGFDESQATFSVTGGDMPLEWSLSDESLGSLSATDGRIANYSRAGVSEGVNEIKVVDVIGRTARAVVVQDDTVEAGPPVISPARSRIAEAGGSVTLIVNRGAPPYSWSMSDASLGSLSNTSQPSVNYHRNATAGVNTIFVTDSAGETGSATVEQPEAPDSITALRVSPSQARIAQPDGVVTLAAAGGVMPYQWSMIDESLGSLSNTDQTAVNYRRNGAASGTNVVELRDSAGNLLVVVIEQP